MMENIKVKIKFDGESQHGAPMSHLWRRKKLWIIIRSALCLAAIAVGAYLMDPAEGGKRNLIPGMMVTIGSVGVLRPMIWQMWMERGMRHHVAYGTEVGYEFSTSGVKMSGVAGAVDLAWKDVYEVCLCRRGMLIYQTKQLYLWVPMSGFASRAQMEEVCAMWRQAHAV